jgi:predicted nucleic acid-binding Zn ribbon protein
MTKERDRDVGTAAGRPRAASHTRPTSPADTRGARDPWAEVDAGAGSRGRDSTADRAAVPPRRGKRPPEALGDIVPRVIAELGLDAVSQASDVHAVFGRIVGADLAPHCRCLGVRHGVVYAAVSDSAWMQRIQLEKPRILHGLRAALGDDRARDLRLQIGKLE